MVVDYSEESQVFHFVEGGNSSVGSSYTLCVTQQPQQFAIMCWCHHIKCPIRVAELLLAQEKLAMVCQVQVHICSGHGKHHWLSCPCSFTTIVHSASQAMVCVRPGWPEWVWCWHPFSIVLWLIPGIDCLRSLCRYATGGRTRIIC